MIDRRQILKATSLGLYLPFFPSLQAGGKEPESKKRLVCIHQTQGMEPKGFFPKGYGKDAVLSPTLEPMKPHLGQFTVFNGLEHNVAQAHYAEHSFLSGVHVNDAKHYPDGNITLDIKVAETIGKDSRFPSFHMAFPGGSGRYDRTSWTRNGDAIVMESNLNHLFHQLFVDPTNESKKHHLALLKENHSLLDLLLTQEKRIKNKLNVPDKHRMEEYLTSVRETEKEIQRQMMWSQKSKPKQDELFTGARPTNVKELFPLYYKLVRMALQTSSTRVVSLQCPVTDNVYSDIDGVHQGYHLLCHHGKSPEKLKQLHLIETFHMQLLSNFLQDLKDTSDETGTLFDQTMVLFGGNMGNPSSHSNHNVPVMLCGDSSIKHSLHRNMWKHKKCQPLCNLYSGMLQKFNHKEEHFNVSTESVHLNA